MKTDYLPGDPVQTPHGFGVVIPTLNACGLIRVRLMDASEHRFPDSYLTRLVPEKTNSQPWQREKRR